MNAERSTAVGHMDAPREGEIDLWLVFEPDTRDEALLDAYRELLTQEERRIESKFYLEQDQRQYLVTRALVRSVLSGYCGIEPQRWQFSTNAQGRPQIATPNVLDGLSFNIARTEGLIACACTTSAHIGVDAEIADLGHAPVDIADRLFSEEEIRELRELSPAARAERFVQYWTLKESYIKANGGGPSMPLDQFSFQLSRRGDIELSFHSGVADNPQRWCCWLMRPAPSHLVSICSLRSSRRTHRVVTRKVVPLVSVETFQCETVARSPQ